MIEAVERLRAGAIGTLRFARCIFAQGRKSIGRGQLVPAPSRLDYSMWQGVAPERSYKSNLIHYNWHWHWHWGNGELGNNGVHSIDVARWGLGVDYPQRVAFIGGRYHFDDDQETPDRGVASYDFGDVGITWECSSCHARKGESETFAAFYGDGGSLTITKAAYVIRDLTGKEIESNPGHREDSLHMENFFTCIVDGGKPNSDIEDAQKSTLLCHLGNISHRTGEMIHFDSKTRRIVGSPAGETLWKREYRDGWEPTV